MAKEAAAAEVEGRQLWIGCGSPCLNGDDGVGFGSSLLNLAADGEEEDDDDEAEAADAFLTTATI